MKYIYGIISSQAAGSNFEPVAFAAPDGKFEIIRAIGSGELAAVVSASTIHSFAELPRGELLRYLALHQRAIEELMDVTPVLPVKFGMLFADDRQVSLLLQVGHDKFMEACRGIGHRFEVDVAVTWDPGQVFAQIAQEPRIGQVKAAVEQMPADQALRGRIALGQLVKEAFDAQRNSVRDTLVSQLSPKVSRWQLNPVMDESMVMNVACLVNEAEETALEEIVYDLDAQYEDQLQFRLVGPLPPYSFATVEVRMVDSQDMAEACQLLELNEVNSTPDQVKHAYHRQARRFHPDATGGDPIMQSQFVRLTAAYRLMTAVTQRANLPGLPGNGQPRMLVNIDGISTLGQNGATA